MDENEDARVAAGHGATGPRRSPGPHERRRDAERTRQELLTAALDVFAAKGFAGARVQDIADQAGVNKQLINYYFDGKEGLYRALRGRWLEREAAFADPDVPLDELTTRYLHDALADPRLVRLLVWRGLTEGAEAGSDDAPQSRDLSNMRRRQADGELAAELDAACVLLMLMGAVVAPIALPQMAARLLGLDPRSPDFEERYGEQLGRVVRRLADPPPTGSGP